MGRGIDLRGSSALITGGARGIGLATARTMLSRGAQVALVDRDGDAAARAASALGDRAVALTADVRDLEALERAAAEAVERLGGLDVVVANAGIGPRTATVEAGDRAQQREVLDVNLHGVWHTVWATTPHIVERRGHVVVVSSIAAFVATPAWAAYGASKAGVEQLARALRIELAPTGATAGVAHFGLVDTDLVHAFESDPLAARLEALGPRAMTRHVSADGAAAALVDGVERRASRTIYPRRWRAGYLARGAAGPLTDAWATRDRGFRGLMRDVRERDRERAAAR